MLLPVTFALDRRLASAGFAFLASAMTWTACSQEPSLFSVEEDTGVGGYLTTATSTGAGGAIIHDDGQGGSGSGVPTPFAALCGEGCVPGTGDGEACALGEGELGSCRLVEDEGHVNGACSPDGPGIAGDACTSANDCRPGFGCVDPGVCRAYCCLGAELCPTDTYCAARAMASGALEPDTAPAIPTCVPIEPCTLFEDSSCSAQGDSCTIVRADGSTSCVTPGNGVAGEGCPCAAGHMCALATDRCMRLCRTKRIDDCPSGQLCSGGSAPYPPGIGVCVDL